MYWATSVSPRGGRDKTRPPSCKSKGMSDQELLDELVASYDGASSPIAIINNGLTAQQIQNLYLIAPSKSHERQAVIFFDNLFKTLNGRVAAVIPVQFRTMAPNGIIIQPTNPTEIELSGPSLRFNILHNSMYIGQLV